MTIKYYLVVDTAVLNVRPRPTTSSVTIKQLHKGDRVEIEDPSTGNIQGASWIWATLAGDTGFAAIESSNGSQKLSHVVTETLSDTPEGQPPSGDRSMHAYILFETTLDVNMLGREPDKSIEGWVDWYVVEKDTGEKVWIASIDPRYMYHLGVGFVGRNWVALDTSTPDETDATEKQE